VALTGGFHAAFLALGAIALIAPPAVFALAHRRETPKGGTALVASEEPMPA